MLGAVAIVSGLCCIAWGYTKFRHLIWSGAALIVAVIVVRLLLASRDNKIQQMILPAENSSCLVSCIFDERDVALFSTRILSLIGWISPAEQNGLLETMASDYDVLSRVQTIIPSPFMRTYLMQQNSKAFDAVVIPPDDSQPAQPAEMGLIFLHGFTGNFTMPCWLIARAVQANHGLTICPSVDWEGDWWTSNGEATLRATIAYLHEQGIKRIYLAGLSNGAVGASELAYKLTNDIEGLILISGASPDAADPQLPILVLAGSHDERMPAEMLSGYTNRMGTEATFVEFQSDHFMLAKDEPEIQQTIASWLQQQLKSVPQ